MHKILTEDNSTTFFNEKYQETYHSKSGAEEEAIEKFAKPALKNIKQQVTILDICFGLGYNSAAAIDLIKQQNPNTKITIIALENDKTILNQIQNINTSFKSYNLIKQLLPPTYETQQDNIKIKLLLGDARETIKQITEKVDISERSSDDAQRPMAFDIIFLDPFSPKKCSELWTEEFFKNIKKLCKPTTILTTYSCAISVRDNLIRAGFQPKDGPCIGRRAPSTIAKILPISDNK